MNVVVVMSHGHANVHVFMKIRISISISIRSGEIQFAVHESPRHGLGLSTAARGRLEQSVSRGQLLEADI